ncbi:hypothetical protein ACIPPS_28925 [Streptomyces sp. NPDC090127]|uniref:hypothetical protein n=1 Tax=Streptomyces sp. NPDC090127 TaxID=3365953 RepID=UPI0037F1A9C3
MIPEGAPRSGVIHIRHRHTERFTVVGNHLAQHEELSAVAIGLAVYIQSLPDGVSVTAKALALRFREGEKTVRRALNELEGAGYLARPRVPVGGGRFATRTLSYDKPGGAAEAGHRTAPDADRPGLGGGAEPDGGLAAEAGHRTAPDADRPGPGDGAEPDGGPGPIHSPSPKSPPSRPSRPSASRPPRSVPTGPAAELLVRLRLADTRLLLSARDVERLAPAVETWLARSTTHAQIVRTLTANLPPEPIPIHHPARFLEYRLTTLLPPSLPAAPATPPGPPPLITCDGCERAFRSRDPEGRCGDCRAVA